MQNTSNTTKKIDSLREKLGYVYSSQEIAEYLSIDEDTVRKYYRQLGGMRLGRRILFFDKLIERSICDAILQQKEEEMDCLRKKERGKETSVIFNEEGSSGVRGKVEKIPKEQMGRRDPFHLLT